MYLRWIAFAVLNLAVTLLAYLLAPILPAFALGSATLPRWLSWFQTPDNPLDGDANFIGNVAPFKGAQTGWRQYLNRVFWLLRNPSYGFGLTVIAFQAQSMALIHSMGPLPPAGGSTKTGWFFVRLWNPGVYKNEQTPPSAFQFVAVWCYSPTRALRLDFGWKLWNPLPCACQFAMTVQPFMSVTP